MAKFSSTNSVSVAQSLDPAGRTADANGSGVDLQGYEDALVVVSIGTTTTTLSSSNRVEIELEESDDNSAWSDVASSDIVGGEGNDTIVDINSNAQKNTAAQASYIGSKRYIRAVANEHGTVAAFTIGVVVVRGRPQTAPPA